jgi:allantoate deiminase
MEGGLYRGWLSPAYRAAREQLAAWMTQAGMTPRIDAAANLIGRYEGTSNAPSHHRQPYRQRARWRVLRWTAGHHAGRGMRGGAACRRAAHALPIEVIAFGDEEGSRFPAAMLTSKAVAGVLDDVPDMADPRA